MNHDVLVRIKRLVLSGSVLFTTKAEVEMEYDGLTEELVCESIMNAPSLTKVLRSENPDSGARENLYVIVGLTYDSLPVYTKGKIVKTRVGEKFYVLISSKKSTD